jgi:hypothetical protein
MKTTILILTMQMVAVMKIFIAYFGLYEFQSYFHFMNILMITVYAIINSVIFIIFVKGQINERQREASISN